MEYKSVLKRLEEQKKNQYLSTKLFRYAGLIQAIQFFSQKLSLEQIIDSAFDFVNELLIIERSAIFVLQEKRFIVRKRKGFENLDFCIENTVDLQNMAVFHGTIMQGKEYLAMLFENHMIEAYQITMVIPLIIESSLYGFILISDKTLGEMNDDDYIITESLMNLFNNALVNCKRYEELQKVNKDLDEKIFNLFAINQSSKAILSELNLDALYNISIDVFAELTQSSITGFVLFDDKREKYILKAFKEIMNPQSDVQVILTFNDGVEIDVSKVIIDTSDPMDILYFNSIFREGFDAIKNLRPKYLVLLVKNMRILGFVSLGQTITNMVYKESIFELTESLASSTYIALSNARLFGQVNEQKEIIQSKFEKIVSLNKLVKNINSSKSYETLLEMTLKTLQVSFDVDKALIAIYNKEKNIFTIENTLNINPKIREITANRYWNKVFEGDTVYDAKEKNMSKYIGKALIKGVGGGFGILIVPIYVDRADIELIGVIIVCKYRKSVIQDEENILILESIAGHIAPVLDNLFTMKWQEQFLLPDYVELFNRDLQKEISDAGEYLTDLHVIHIEDLNSYLFQKNAMIEQLRKRFNKVYPFNENHIFIMDNKPGDVDDLKEMSNVRVQQMALGKDFKNMEDFFKLFEDK